MQIRQYYHHNVDVFILNGDVFIMQQPPNSGYPNWQQEQPQNPFPNAQQQPYSQHQPPYQQPWPQAQYPNLQAMPPVQPIVKKKRRTGLFIGLGVLVVALAICAIIGTAMSNAASNVATTTTTTSNTTTQQQQQQSAPTGTWKTTHTFKGNGTSKTATFAVGNDWKLNWTCDPASFQNTAYNVIIMVYNTDGSLADQGVNALCKAGATSGKTEIRTSGNVYLSVISEGSWNAVIQELK